MNEEPQNKDGQKPTRKPEETRDRLEQKKHEDVGNANRNRIEDKQEEVAR